MSILTVKDKIEEFAKALESSSDRFMQSIVSILRYVFIAIMVIYLFDCLYSLLYKVIALSQFKGGLDFTHIKELLTDALFTLIVLAVVRTLFLKNGLDYAIAFLEIGFVVVMRKLILLDVTSENTMLIFALGIIVTLFFVMILYVYKSVRAPSQVE